MESEDICSKCSREYIKNICYFNSRSYNWKFVIDGGKMPEEDKEDKDWIDKWIDRIGGFLCLLAVTGSLLLFVIMIFLLLYWV